MVKKNASRAPASSSPGSPRIYMGAYNGDDEGSLKAPRRARSEDQVAAFEKARVKRRKLGRLCTLPRALARSHARSHARRSRARSHARTCTRRTSTRTRFHRTSAHRKAKEGANGQRNKEGPPRAPWDR
jgi:hypothetical protein